ncbi:unnamed protein product [Closterium sp. NIES-54]
MSETPGEDWFEVFTVIPFALHLPPATACQMPRTALIGTTGEKRFGRSLLCTASTSRTAQQVKSLHQAIPQSEGLGFESQCVHFGHPNAGGCQRSTGDPRLIIGKGYRLVVLGGYGRTDPLLNKPFYPNGLVVGILTVLRRVRLGEWSRVQIPVYAHVGRCRCAFAWGVIDAL